MAAQVSFEFPAEGPTGLLFRPAVVPAGEAGEEEAVVVSEVVDGPGALRPVTPLPPGVAPALAMCAGSGVVVVDGIGWAGLPFVSCD
jgi:hypothetical protein